MVHNAGYTVDVVSGPRLSPMRTSTLASAMFDYNLSNSISHNAKVLFTNAATRMDGVSAICAFVSESLKYDYDSRPSGTVFAPSSTVLRVGNGQCVEFTDLAVAMLRSIGIAAKTITGEAPIGSKPNNHEWLEVAVDGRTMLVDPTWNNDGSPLIPEFLSNQYTTVSGTLPNHKADPSMINKWEWD